MSKQTENKENYELEEGEISNEINKSPEKNNTIKPDDDSEKRASKFQRDDEEEDKGFFFFDHKKQPKAVERERSRSPKFSPKRFTKYNPNYNNKFFQMQNTQLSYLQSKNLKRDLCKYFLNGTCTKGERCTYSHALKDFPCKFFNSRGFCENKDKCKFSHKKLTKDEMNKFIADNEQFLIDQKNKYGKIAIESELNEYFENKKKSMPFYNNNINPAKSSSFKIYQNAHNQTWLMNQSLNGNFVPNDMLSSTNTVICNFPLIKNQMIVPGQYSMLNIPNSIGIPFNMGYMNMNGIFIPMATANIPNPSPSNDIVSNSVDTNVKQNNDNDVSDILADNVSNLTNQNLENVNTSNTNIK